jgi:DNA-binding response OmpR family regulator
MTDMTPAQGPSKGNVLFIDDDKFLVEMYGMKFEREGYTVHTVLSADEGLELLRSGFQADAVLFDIAMTGKDGFAFLTALKEEKLVPRALCIALTNQSDDVERQKMMALGADDYLIKATVIPSEVVNTVAAALSRRKGS